MKQFFKMFFASLLGVLVAGFISSLVVLLIVFALTSTDSDKVTIDKPMWLEIDISGTIKDRYEKHPLDALFSSYSEEQATSLIDILTAIDRAKEHQNIIGVFLKCNPMNAGYGTTKEIRDKLEELKKTGKKVIAYADFYSQKSYYVASVADCVFLNPLGAVELSGMSVNKIYFKGTLDKLGVDVQVFKVGTYKSAVEPFINKSMSSEDRAQTDSYLQSIWGTVSESIAKSRKIESKQLNDWVNQGILMDDPNDLITKKLINGITYESDLKTTAKDSKDSTEITIERIKMDKFLASTESVQKHSDKIALVFAEGEIDGSEDEGIVSRKLIKELVAIQKDDAVKAVVLRINSPGGSGFGSEQILHELDKLKGKKPLIVSMGDYAASGGYYIACKADAIVAQPTTLTGSIGVFGLFPDFQELFGKIGITNSVVKTHQFSDFGDFSRPMTELERKMMQSSIDRFYKLFLTRCSEGRKLKTERIDQIAQGRVWSGKQALDLKLVDQMGGLSKAVELAAKKAKIDKYELVEYPAKKEWFVRLMDDLNTKMSFKIASFFSNEEQNLIKELRRIDNRDKVRAEMGAIPVLD